MTAGGTFAKVDDMAMSDRESVTPANHSVEANLRLSDDGVISGTVSVTEADPTPFHGWLELMDMIESIRTQAQERHRI